MKRLSSIILAVAVLVTSCTKKDDYRLPSIEEVNHGELPSVFSLNSWEFDPLGGETFLAYTADGDWKVSGPDWVSVKVDNRDKASGTAGTAVISVSAGINGEWTGRDGKLTFTCNGETHEILLSQDFPKLGLTVDTNNGDIETSSPAASKEHPAAEGNIGFKWFNSHEVDSEPVYLHISGNTFWLLKLPDNAGFDVLDEDSGRWKKEIKGQGKKTVRLNPTSNNYGTDDKTAGMTLIAYTGDNYKDRIREDAVGNFSMELSQTFLTFLVNGSAEDRNIRFSGLGKAYNDSGISTQRKAEIQIDCELPWELRTPGTFASFGDGESDKGSATEQSPERTVFTDKRTVVVDHANPTTTTRQEDLVIVAKDGDNHVAERTIHVSQDGYRFLLRDGGNEVFNSGMKAVRPNGLFSGDGTRVYDLDGKDTLKFSMILETFGSWEITPLSEEDAQWLKIHPMHGDEISESQPGTEDRVIEFSVAKQNLNLRDIDAVVNIRANYPWNQSSSPLNGKATVVQEAFKWGMEGVDALQDLSATKIYEDPNGEEQESHPVAIQSSGPWSVRKYENGTISNVTEADWVRFSTLTGNSDASSEDGMIVGSRYINPDMNSPRTERFILMSDIHESLSSEEKSACGYSPKFFDVVQRKFTFELIFSGENVSEEGSKIRLAAYKRNFTDALNIRSDGNWELSELSWINPTSRQGEGNMQGILLNPSENTSLSDPRSGTIVATCTYNKHGMDIHMNKTLSIEQDKLVFSVEKTWTGDAIPAVVNFNSSVLGKTVEPFPCTYRVTATDELPWRVDPFDYSFADGTVFSGSGSGEAKLYPSHNSGASRTWLLRFSTTEGSETIFPTISIQQDGYEFDDNEVKLSYTAMGRLIEGDNPFQFNCSGPWIVSSKPSWVTLQNMKGENDPSIKIETIEINQGRGESGKRPGVIEVQSEIGGMVKTVSIQQEQFYFDTTETDVEQFPTLDTQEKTIEFVSSGPWKLKDLASNVIVDNKYKSGEGEDSEKKISLVFRLADNFEERQIPGSFKICSTVTPYEKLIKYTQAPFVFTLSDGSVTMSDGSRITLNGPKDTDPRTYTVTESSSDWKLGEDYDHTIVDCYRSGNSVTVTPKANYTKKERTAQLEFITTRDNKTRRTINILQPAYTFPADKSFSIEATKWDEEITIASSGDWTVESDSNWLTCTPNSGTETKGTTIKISAEENSSNSERTGKLTIKGSDDPSSLVATITVTQKNKKK